MPDRDRVPRRRLAGALAVSAIAFFRAFQAEVEAAQFSFITQMSAYTWGRLRFGKAPWTTRKLKRLAGRADIRSIPIDWASVLRGLRVSGYTGKVPRSLRRFDYVEPPFYGLLTHDWRI